MLTWIYPHALRILAAGALALAAMPAAVAQTRYVVHGNSGAEYPFTSWATAAPEIQPAIDAAAPGDTVVVTNGLYDTGGPSARVLITNAITVISTDGPAATIIDGTGAVTCVSIENPGAVLSGFTITRGRGEYGGGIRINYGGTVRNCTVSNNYAEYYGGGIALYGGGIVEDSRICWNVAGHRGGGLFQGANGLVRNSVIAYNTAGNAAGGAYLIHGLEVDGVGVAADTDELAIKSSVILGNVAPLCSGVFLYRSGVLESSLVVSNSGSQANAVFLYFGGYMRACRVEENTSTSTINGTVEIVGGSVTRCTITRNLGIGVSLTNGGLLENCVVSRNTGMGVRMKDNNARLFNSTIVYNGSYGAYLPNLNNPYRAQVMNNVIWGNGTNHHLPPDQCSILSHLCTTPTSGSACITSDPNFVSAAADNFQLSPTSLCVDAGLEDPQLSGIDANGVARPLDGNHDGVAIRDIGAFEHVNAVADSDADAMPDGYELDHGLSPTNAADASEDPDGDGADNYGEFVADTNPGDAGSVFEIVELLPGAPGAGVRFAASTNRIYRLERSADLVGGPWADITAYASPEMVGETAYLEDPAPSTATHYRVRVALP